MADVLFPHLPEAMCAVGVVLLVASIAHGRREFLRRRQWRAARKRLPYITE